MLDGRQSQDGQIHAPGTGQAPDIDQRGWMRSPYVCRLQHAVVDAVGDDLHSFRALFKPEVPQQTANTDDGVGTTDCQLLAQGPNCYQLYGTSKVRVAQLLS